MATMEDDDKPLELPIITRTSKKSKRPTTIDDTRPRDPRFDPRCAGSNDPRHFIKNYSFLEDVRKKELDTLNKAVRKERDPTKKDQIKMTITRYKNKMIDIKNKAKPKAKGSCEKKTNLVEQYKELKQSGKLTKYLERKRKKLIKRDQKSFAN